jgi:hypothetical protein
VPDDVEDGRGDEGRLSDSRNHVSQDDLPRTKPLTKNRPCTAGTCHQRGSCHPVVRSMAHECSAPMIAPLLEQGRRGLEQPLKIVSQLALGESRLHYQFPLEPESTPLFTCRRRLELRARTQSAGSRHYP